MNFMSTSLWLRISSVISLLFAAGHAMGGLKYWSPMGDNPVFQAMKSTRFDTMGVNRSYFEFYMGFGHSLTVAQVMQAIVLWQLAAIARTNALGVRPVIVVIALATLASGLISWRFLFPVPALFSLVLLASLVVACVVAR
jgi:hypothetical protein